MKRKIAWLALPLVLAALMVGVKWRAEHPTPTKEDLEIRALLMKSSKIAIQYDPPNWFEVGSTPAEIDEDELKQFVDCFYVLPKDSQPHPLETGGEVALVFCSDNGKTLASFRVNTVTTGEEGTVRTPSGMVKCDVRSITAKRWVDLLLLNSRIGPLIQSDIEPYKRSY